MPTLNLYVREHIKLISVCVVISFEIMVPTSTDLELFAKDAKFAVEQKQKDYFNFGSYFTFAAKL